MNTQQKIALLVLGACALLGAVAFFGFSPYMKTVAQNFGATSQGATGNSAFQYNVYGVNLAASGASATSSSVLNTSGQDLYVTGITAACEGVGTSKTAYTGTGLSALTLSVGTSSAANPTVVPANLVGGAAVTIATSSVQFVVASTTAQNGTGLFSNIWLAGSEMTFWANATNTAVCTFGVSATQS